ncbi:hypothetical protein HOLleu_08980 [Holothuria leucospilota]|uniref:Uncharacterized protein n=1 Tax=Holothuria leucospilota TaxID=206669 RepID=A0A9Q1CK05_HOLLE|nr:hypothetical protein HOLleu_08980 [Holothuria leucospilota]
MTILRNQRKDEKFRSDIKELKENLGLIKARMDMITTYRLAKRKQTNFQKKICQARRNFWKELPHIEHFFVCAACVMFASLLCLYLVRALVLLLLPQIFLECHPNISQVLKYKINSSLCS